MSNVSGKKSKKSIGRKSDKKSALKSLQQDSEVIPANSIAQDSSKIQRWSFIQNDLEKALDHWDDLETQQPSQSPEEEQLEKIKTIIGQLKDKLNQF